MRNLLFTFFALTALGVAAAERPNFVYLLIDDLGYQETGFTDGPYKTPNIDRLANGGTVLTDFYALQVCSPTRAALMTGRHPLHNGLHVGVVRPWAQYGLPLEERLLPQALKEAGYTTAICGKWHLGHFQRAYLPTQRGFDFQYGHYNGMIDCFKHERDGGFDWHRNDRECRDEGYSTELIAREAVKIIEQQPAEKPLFLYVPFNAVHSPLQAPPEYFERAKYRPEKDRNFTAMLTALDDAIGRIVDALDKKGLRKNTLIAFSSDNGGPRAGTNGQFRDYKGSLYEGGVRVAAFANWPGVIPAGKKVDQPMHIIDWYPTLVKLAGGSLEQKLPLDGRDIWPVLTQGAKSPHDELILNAEPNVGAIRIGDWKLVVHHAADDDSAAKPKPKAKAKRKAAGARAELFNLRSDPGEKENLAEREPERLKAMQARLDFYTKQAAPSRQVPQPKDFKAPRVWGE